MKKLLFILMAICLLAPAFARNDVMTFSIKEALEDPEDPSLKGFLSDEIKLEFGTGSKAEIITRQVSTNQKTNSFNKSSKNACQRSFYSALKRMQDRALRDGGTKVVNITGYYYKQHFDSKTEFQCGVGNVVSGVTLRADIAK